MCLSFTIDTFCLTQVSQLFFSVFNVFPSVLIHTSCMYQTYSTYLYKYILVCWVVIHTSCLKYKYWTNIVFFKFGIIVEIISAYQSNYQNITVTYFNNIAIYDNRIILVTTIAAWHAHIVTFLLEIQMLRETQHNLYHWLKYFHNIYDTLRCTTSFLNCVVC